MAPLSADWQVLCSHLDDPFPGMIRWLEEIVRGADSARWPIGEEGSVAQFVFLRGRRLLLDAAMPLLLLHRSDANGRTICLSSCAVSPIGVVGGFYRAFRGFVEGERYDPNEWANEGDDEDWPWRGADLRSLRSQLIEAELGGDGGAAVG